MCEKKRIRNRQRATVHRDDDLHPCYEFHDSHYLLTVLRIYICNKGSDMNSFKEPYFLLDVPDLRFFTILYPAAYPGPGPVSLSVSSCSSKTIETILREGSE